MSTGPSQQVTAKATASAMPNRATPLRRPLLLGLLALLHLGLGWLMVQQLRAKPSAQPGRQAQQTVLIPIWLNAGKAKSKSNPRSELQATSAPNNKVAKAERQPAKPNQPDDRVTTSITLITPSAAPSIAAAASAPTPAPAPLNLQLPGTAQERAQAAQDPKRPSFAATQDPRSNSQRPDLGERMASALGSDPSRVETITGDGKRRVRQGSLCIDMEQPRIARLDPFNQGINPTPALAKLCDK